MRPNISEETVKLSLHFDATTNDGLETSFSNRLTDNHSTFASELEQKVDSFRTGLKKFFLPDKESERDPHAFGTIEITARVKKVESIKANLLKRWQTLKFDPDSRESEVKSLLADMEALEKNNTPSIWCEVVHDLIGVRVIVRTQRNKYQIYRAFSYLCDLNARVRKPRLPVPSVGTVENKPWKYFNPPMMRAYYRPLAVQEVHEAFRDLTKRQLLDDRDRPTTDALHVLQRLHKATSNISYEFKTSGYATLQTNLQFEDNTDTHYIFEVQIRTALEHAWSEPEHAMIYKGSQSPLSEHVRGLFRSYGLSLSASDDLLQFVMDEWRRETDDRADYTDRALRTFKLDQDEIEQDSQLSQKHSRHVLQKDRNLLYDCLTYGLVYDAISIAESLADKAEPGSFTSSPYAGTPVALST